MKKYDNNFAYFKQSKNWRWQRPGTTTHVVQILFGMESGNKTREHLLHFMGDLVHIDTTVGGHLRVVAIPALQEQQNKSKFGRTNYVPFSRNETLLDKKGASYSTRSSHLCVPCRSICDRDQEHTGPIQPLTCKNQAIKSFRRDNQVIKDTFCLDPSRKRFNR